MPVLAVIGAQWGDEGKGKIVDLLAENAHVVARYQGGANAGHEVVVGGTSFILHLVPSGILHKDKINIIGNGVVLDPESFEKEVKDLKKRGIKVAGRLFVSDRAQLTLSLHKQLDAAREGSADGKKIGSTKRGISPTYMDKAGRVGLRPADLNDPAYCRSIIKANLLEKNVLFQKLYGVKPLSAAAVYAEVKRHFASVKPFQADTTVMIHDFVAAGKNILLEGAQGTLLDIDHGTYPYVTASNSTAGGAASGVGLGPTQIGRVMGVCKAYTTRVGEGPFPTEFDPKKSHLVRELGGEYGRTTGRARRCGWLDMVGLRHAVRVNGLTELAITKLDVLDTMDEIGVCVAYKVGSKTLTGFPASVSDLSRAKPVFKMFKGWLSSTKQCRTFASLPKNAQLYLKAVEKMAGTSIGLVSVGADRSETIFVNRKAFDYKF
ncbi:MAG: adenylosuccinate synthase [candidate division FCPU426 bacterium]